MGFYFKGLSQGQRITTEMRLSNIQVSNYSYLRGLVE